jgi:Holliday junction resolvase RusA-like endonuclease
MEVYADDTQVVRLETVKRYANDEKPGASIRIEINQ